MEITASTPDKITIYGTTYSMRPLDPKEYEVFNRDFELWLSGTPDSVLRKILMARKKYILAGLRIILNSPELKGRVFRGFGADDEEIGWTAPRWCFFKAGGSVLTSWSTSVSTSWSDWLYESSDTGYVLSDYFGYIITHLTSLVSPEPYVRQVYFKIGRKEHLPIDVSKIILGDNENNVAYMPIPIMIVPPSTQFLAKHIGESSGTDKLIPDGVIVGLGRALKQLTNPFI